MNVIEKILADHSDKAVVSPGQIIDVNLDFVMANDATGCLTIDIFQKELQANKLFDPDKVILVLDHYTPSSSVDSANSHARMRTFAHKHGIQHLYDGQGICHQLMLEHHVRPGQLVIGADSHTCSYGALGALATGMGSTDIAVAWQQGRTWMRVPSAIKIEVSGEWPSGVQAKDLILKIIGDLTVQGATYKALCFSGPAISALEVSERITLTNMAIEAGAKFGFIPADAKTKAYMKGVGRPDFSYYSDDEDAEYEQVYTYDVSQLEPQVATPHSVDNVDTISTVEGTRIDEIFLGACTNGRYEDLETAAAILHGKKIANSVRMLVTPASKDIFLRALESGIIATFVECGAMINSPGCSACFGGSGGILGKNEKLLTTANRNFRGRVGSPDSEIYLASTATVAASALYGYITDPRRIAR